MESIRLAVPSQKPGGLEADRSDHFGHCDVFTIVQIENNTLSSVETIANSGHEAGGCMVPVRFLQEQGVEAIVVGGIGARPLRGFNEAGIKVYFADPSAARDVRSVVDGMRQQRFPLIRGDQVCQGHGHCH